MAPADRAAGSRSVASAARRAAGPAGTAVTKPRGCSATAAACAACTGARGAQPGGSNAPAVGPDADRALANGDATTGTGRGRGQFGASVLATGSATAAWRGVPPLSAARISWSKRAQGSAGQAASAWSTHCSPALSNRRSAQRTESCAPASQRALMARPHRCPAARPGRPPPAPVTTRPPGPASSRSAAPAAHAPRQSAQKQPRGPRRRRCPAPRCG